jgi:hypothetical protein
MRRRWSQLPYIWCSPNMQTPCQSFSRTDPSAPPLPWPPFPASEKQAFDEMAAQKPGAVADILGIVLSPSGAETLPQVVLPPDHRSLHL